MWIFAVTTAYFAPPDHRVSPKYVIMTAKIHVDLSKDPRQQSTKVEKLKVHDISFPKHKK